MVSPDVELGVTALVGRESDVGNMGSKEQHKRVQSASEADGGCDAQQNPVPVPDESRFGMLEELYEGEYIPNKERLSSVSSIILLQTIKKLKKEFFGYHSFLFNLT